MESKIEQQKQHFESVSDRYFDARQDKNHLFLKHLIWDYFLSEKKFLKKEGLEVLEPMCGYSEGLKIIERYISTVKSYEGFDYSSVLVKKVNDTHPELHVYECDIAKFTSDKTYNLIIIIGGLHHVPSIWKKVLGDLKNYLNPGGHFILLEPTHNNILFRKIRERIYKKNTLFDEETERAFELSVLNTAFKEEGYQVIDQVYPGLLSYVLFYNPDAFPFLNIGGNWLVKATFAFDKLFMRNWIGKKLSFATLTLLRA